MRISALCILGASISAIVAGCGSEEPGSSTITGTIDQASFPLVVESIDIISDIRAPTTAAVASDGSFTLTLLAGASYRFALGADGSIPLILRTDDERLQTLITITGGDAKVDIGSVRFWDGSATADRSGGATSTTDPARGEETTADTCVDGLIGRTGQPCSTGEATVVCEEKGGRHGPGRKGRHHPGDDMDRPDEPMNAEPEVEIVDDPATDASPRQAIAIPERTLATGIGCKRCPGM